MRTRFLSDTLTFAGTALLLSGIYITMYDEWIPPVVWHEHAQHEVREATATTRDKTSGLFLPLQHIFPNVLIERVDFKNEASGDETAVQGCRSSSSATVDAVPETQDQPQQHEQNVSLLNWLHPVLDKKFHFRAN
jgi:hypothetical protein